MPFRRRFLRLLCKRVSIVRSSKRIDRLKFEMKWRLVTSPRQCIRYQLSVDVVADHRLLQIIMSAELYSNSYSSPISQIPNSAVYFSQSSPNRYSPVYHSHRIHAEPSQAQRPQFRQREGSMFPDSGVALRLGVLEQLRYALSDR